MLDKKVGDEFLWESQEPLSEPIQLTTEGLRSCLRCHGDKLMSPSQALKSRQEKTPTSQRGRTALGGPDFKSHPA